MGFAGGIAARRSRGSSTSSNNTHRRLESPASDVGRNASPSARFCGAEGLFRFLQPSAYSYVFDHGLRGLLLRERCQSFDRWHFWNRQLDRHRRFAYNYFPAVRNEKSEPALRTGLCCGVLTVAFVSPADVQNFDANDPAIDIGKNVCIVFPPLLNPQQSRNGWRKPPGAFCSLTSE